MKKQLVVLTVVLLFAGGVLLAATTSRPEPEHGVGDVVHQSTSNCTVSEDEALGNGAFADWKATGRESLDANGRSSVGTLLLHGAEDRDMKL